MPEDTDASDQPRRRPPGRRLGTVARRMPVLAVVLLIVTATGAVAVTNSQSGTSDATWFASQTTLDTWAADAGDDLGPELTVPDPPSTTTDPAPAVTTGTASPPAEVQPRAAPDRETPPVAAGEAGPAVVRPPAAADTAVRCLVELHGKGSSGSATSTSDGIVRVAPSGNAAGWGGRQWLYSAPGEYASARAVVAQAIDVAGCGAVVVHGFSNGAAFAAKLFCQGETFGGRLRRVVIDDPVTDHATAGCHPASGVNVTLYWTGALAGIAPAGWACAMADWTCEGGSSVGIDAYAASVGVAVTHSPMGGHAPFTNAPELHQF
jgi:hypothetical protein